MKNGRSDSVIGAFATNAEDRCSIPGRVRPKLLKQAHVVTDPLPNVRQQV